MPHRKTVETVSCSVGPGSVRCHLSRPEDSARGVAVLIHGRNGAAHQPHIQVVTDAYLRRGWRVAVPDLPFSDATPGAGAPEEVTMEAHRAAAAQVIDWVAAGRAPDERLALCGHSLGSDAVACAADGLSNLHHLMAVSPVLSGQALLDARAAMGQDALDALSREAPRMRATMAGMTCAPALARLAIPLAVMTGALDGLTPPAAARAYFDAARDPRFFMVLPQQHHCPQGDVVARALETALDAMDA